MFTFATSTSGPWIHCISVAPDVALEELNRFKSQFPKFHVTIMYGSQMPNLESAFWQFQNGFLFPDYFGNNGNAFDECINDLEWISAEGYLGLILDAEKMLSDSIEDKRWLMRTLSNAGHEWARPVAGEWARPAIPFHFALQANDASFAAETGVFP